VAVVILAGAVLTAAASIAPTRRATRIAPVVALAVD
jgi:putative ABC transport system permease protein